MTTLGIVAAVALLGALAFVPIVILFVWVLAVSVRFLARRPELGRATRVAHGRAVVGAIGSWSGPVTTRTCGRCCKWSAPADDDRSRRAAGRSTARSATSGSAPTATTSTSSRPGGSPRLARRSLRRAGRARAAVRRRDRCAHRRRLRRACASGARLKQAGIDDVRIDRRSAATSAAPGTGTAIPGAMCDTAAMVYLPLLEETGHMPSAEVRARARDLRALPAHRQARSTSTTTRCSRPRSPRSSGTTPSARWIVRTDRGDAVPRAVRRDGHRSAATGRSCRASRASRSFGGHCFHTSRWDYDYTGGDYGRRADDEARRQAGRHHRHRRDRGAVHPAARTATRRSSSCSSARRRRSTCATTTRSTRSGSQRSSRVGSSEWLLNFATLQTGGFADEDLVKDGWTDISQRIRDRIIARDGQRRHRVHARARPSARSSKTATTRRWRRSAPASTRSSPTRRPPTALKPWYRQLCKRPCFHDEYLQAYNEPERATSSTPTARASSASTRPACGSAASHYELDCLVFASGFEVGTELRRAARVSRRSGRDGCTLSDRWADGMRVDARHPRARLPEPLHRRVRRRART